MKIKQIAAEFSTKSKRIIEKLEEIGIRGKGPMSVLGEDEVEKLYSYMGVIRPKTKEAAESEPKEQKREPVIRPSASTEKASPTQHTGQYIIRRTVVEDKSNDNYQKKDSKKRYVISSDDSGLLHGYTTKKVKPRTSYPKTEEKVIEKKEEVLQKKEVADKEVIQKKPVKKKKVIVADTKLTEEQKGKAADVKKEEVIVKTEKKVTSKVEVKSEVKKTEHKPLDRTKKPYKKPETDKPRYKSTTHDPKKSFEKGKDAPYNKDHSTRPSRPGITAFNKVANEERPKSKRTMKKQDRSVVGTNTKPLLKPDKGQAKKPGRKIEQQKLAKKETSVESKTKKITRTSEDITSVDLKTTARLFSEEQVAGKGIADEKVLDFYSKATPKYKSRSKKSHHRKLKTREIQKPSIPSEIKIDETISVKDLAEMIKKTAGSVITKLMNLGIMASANEVIDFDTATIIADEFGVKALLKEVKTEEDILFDDEKEDVDENLEVRPPIVVVMGHVDHGKTSLLDAIKKTNVIDSEAGGITQHIGAYMINIHDRDITFLDTPGHEAFTSLRARGAQVTDIAIIVVAADDGIMPQTIEAINHAKAANVNIIIAINKIDKPNVDIEKVKQELTEYGLVTEEWGGDTVCVPISAKENQNIEELLDMVILSADMLELKVNPERQAKGTVIDASLDKNRGVITTLIVQRGTLKLGDSVVTGTTVGKIRAMTDYKGSPLDHAGPSTPVEIIGMPEVPEAGELFYAINDQKLARQLAEKRRKKMREEQLNKQNAVSLEDFFSRIKEGEIKDLNLILKADVQGSIEALKQSLTNLGNEEVSVKILHDAVGTVTEHDVSLAQVSGATIIGFNVRPPASVMETAEKSKVDIRLYSIIYEVIEDVENALKGMLSPKFKEEVLGHAEIRETFKVSGVGTIAGCYVTDGKIIRNAKVRLVRNGVVAHTGELASLKRFKDDVKEVVSGYECGTSIERFNDIKIGDIIENYHIIEEERI